MSPAHLKQRLNSICRERLPCPGTGSTAQRHRRLMEVAREDVSLARLAEAHWDAIAILDEARRRPQPGALYGVWASEAPGKPLLVETCGPDYHLSGSKMFCSGAGLVDRALVTVGIPGYSLLEVDLRSAPGCVEIDLSPWTTDAFRSTQTGTVTFHSLLFRNIPRLESPDGIWTAPAFGTAPAGRLPVGPGVSPDYLISRWTVLEETHTHLHILPLCMQMSGRSKASWTKPAERSTAVLRIAQPPGFALLRCGTWLSGFAPIPYSISLGLTGRLHSV